MDTRSNDREVNLVNLARAHRIYLASGVIFRPAAELWIDKLTDEMLVTEEPLPLPFDRPAPRP